MNKIQIKIGEKIYTREWLRVNQEKARYIYKWAKRRESKPFCLCKQEGIPMHFAERNEICTLKRNRNSGPLHHEECPSHADPEKFKSQIRKLHAIEKTPNGKEKIYVEFNLKSIKKVNTPRGTATTKTKSNKKRERFSLREFFLLLWERGGFCNWNPELDLIPTYNKIVTKISRVAFDIVVRGHKLQDILIFPNSQVAQLYENRIFNVCSDKKREGTNKCIIIGLINNIRKGKKAFLINLYKAPQECPIFIQSNGYKKILKSFDSSLITDKGVYVNIEKNECYWLIATVTINKLNSQNKVFINIEEYSVIKTTKRYVPL